MRIAKTDIHDLLEHLVIASKEGSWASEEDSDDDADGLESLEDIKTRAEGVHSAAVDDGDLMSFMSQFNKKGKREMRREMSKGKTAGRKRVSKVRFDIV